MGESQGGSVPQGAQEGSSGAMEGGGEEAALVADGLMLPRKGEGDRRRVLAQPPGRGGALWKAGPWRELVPDSPCRAELS